VRTAVILTLLPLLALSSRAFAEDSPRAISTSGEAVVYVTPDEVNVVFGVETFDPDLDRAKSTNDANAAKLVKAIHGLGIEPRYVQTDQLQVEIQYRSNRAYQGIEGYFARRSYAVKLKDPKLFEKLVATALKNGANQISGIDFRTSELRKYRDQARKMAVKAAREKAVALAQELDCGVGKPRTITEGYNGYFGGYRFNAMTNAQNSMQELPAAAGDDTETLPLGQIAVRAQISVTFDLTDPSAKAGQAEKE